MLFRSLTKSGKAAEVQSVQQFASLKPGTLPRVAAAELAAEPESAAGEGEVAAADAKAFDPCKVCVPAVVAVPAGVPLRLDYDYSRVLDYVKSGSVGVKVNITPYVGQESAEVDLSIAVSDVNGYSPQGSPIINTRYLNSYVRLKDGVPYMVGGITRKEVVKASNKVPLLGDIPVLGWLFGGEQSSASESEIVIVLTPRFMLDSQSKMEIPEEAQTVIRQVADNARLEIPSNPFGFDQWLLDKEK